MFRDLENAIAKTNDSKKKKELNELLDFFRSNEKSYLLALEQMHEEETENAIENEALH